MKKQTEIGLVFLATVLAYLLLVVALQFVSPPPYLRLIIVQLVVVLPTAVYLLIKKENLKEGIRLKKMRLLNVPLLMVFAFLILPFLAICNAISMLFSNNVISGSVETIISDRPLWLSLVLIALIPCILEETVYRGMFYNEFRKENPCMAIILSGLLFGLMHMNFNQFVYAFALGCILPLVIEATDSILSSMVIHFTINANSVIWMYLIPKLVEWVQKMLQEAAESGDAAAEALIKNSGLTGGELEQTLGNVQMNPAALLSAIGFYGVVSVITVFLAFLLYRSIAKEAGRWEYVCNIFGKKTAVEKNVTSLFSLPLGLGMAICFGFMLVTQLVA